jgi:hypothetical protein
MGRHERLLETNDFRTSIVDACLHRHPASDLFSSERYVGNATSSVHALDKVLLFLP